MATSYHNYIYAETAKIVLLDILLFAGRLSSLISRDRYGNAKAVKHSSFPGYWMGGTAMETPGNWMWIKSRDRVDFTFINDAFVNRTGNGCLCFDGANMHQTRTKACHTQMYSICEKPPTKN